MIFYFIITSFVRLEEEFCTIQSCRGGSCGAEAILLVMEFVIFVFNTIKQHQLN
jgi:hypothetical protein